MSVCDLPQSTHDYPALGVYNMCTLWRFATLDYSTLDVRLRFATEYTRLSRPWCLIICVHCGDLPHLIILPLMSVCDLPQSTHDYPALHVYYMCTLWRFATPDYPTLDVCLRFATVYT